MAKYENRKAIKFLLGIVIGALVVYAIVVTSGYHKYILPLKTGTINFRKFEFRFFEMLANLK